MSSAEKLFRTTELLHIAIQRMDGDGTEENPGLIEETKQTIKCIEDAIVQLGEAYDVESEAAKRMETVHSELKSLIEKFSSELIKDLESSKGGLRDTISKILKDSIAGESDKIVADLAKTLKADLLYDVREESVRHVLGKNIEEASKAALAKKVNELEAAQAVYKLHYKEANFWRGAAPWMIGGAIIGGAGIAALAAVVYFVNTGAIQIIY